MDNIALLELATATFSQRLGEVTPDQWNLPTPCEGWTVGDLVVHVIGGNAMAVALANGARADEGVAVLDGTVLAEDVATQFSVGADEQVRAFTRDGIGEQVLHHPAGDMPGAIVLGFRIGDLTIHAWDLAQATGGDDTLPDALVERVHATLLPMAPIIGSIGMFGDGPSLDESAEVSLQQRMLDLAGRRP